MAIPTSKPITLSTVQGEYGGSNPISMSEYRGKGNAPASGPIDLWGDFNGTSNIVTVNQKVFADNYVRFSDSANLTSSYQPAISNQNTASFISAGTKIGELYQTNETYARNLALESSIGGAGNIVAVRKCVIYIGVYVSEGINFNSSARARPLDASGVIMGAGEASKGSPSGVYHYGSNDLIANPDISDAKVKEFLSTGCEVLLGWFTEETLQPRVFSYYADVDFDYQP